MLFLVILLVSFFAYTLNQQSYSSAKYGFKFTDTRGWTTAALESGEGITFKTKLSNGLDSYVYVNIIPHSDDFMNFAETFMTKDYSQEYSELCKTTARENNMEFKTINPTNIENANAYLCESETKNSNNDLIMYKNYLITTAKSNILITYIYNPTET
ncbi:hypothetical protein COY32_05895 [candidate division WWE3 bacterium CG_4_10_14_0_2_um_filter_41_14]|uniref:Uncharacterized protein n=1 Tax=candidate division WWE3 bacterium CG_4_10_14_0_2_um_filter_41_14 TaxID=1975072 RepID=A0A2M7TFY6_UNCKA|nr:MAG: hypothetical protein COY32_05895 [candidate division WWE3 bacterium CG_4_10_14_0_2_um_filter_41_14]